MHNMQSLTNDIVVDGMNAVFLSRVASRESRVEIAEKIMKSFYLSTEWVGINDCLTVPKRYIIYSYSFVSFYCKALIVSIIESAKFPPGNPSFS
jgi:hypothetical protein